MWNNLNQKEKYLVAISGGPDSIFLLNYLYDKLGYQNLILCHVNYMTRTNSNEAETIVNTLGKKFNLEVKTLRSNKSSISKMGSNFQHNARVIRYEFFADIYNKEKCSGIFIGHQANDIIESYIWQLNNRNNVMYPGIKEINNYLGMNIYRPILNFWKSDILKFLAENQIKFNHDYTNDEPNYERNKIRIELSKKSQIELNYLLEEVNKINFNNHNLFLLIKNKLNCDNSTFSINKYSKLSISEKLLFLINISSNLINEKQILEIDKFLNSNKNKNNKWYYKNFYLQKEYELARYSFENTNENFTNYYIDDIFKIFTKSFGPIQFSKIEKEGWKKYALNAEEINEVGIFNYGTLPKIYKFDRRKFIKKKIPQTLRKYWPIFINRSDKTVIFVPMVFEPKLNNNIVVKKFEFWYK